MITTTAILHWHSYPEQPVIPQGQPYVDILYRSAPASDRMAVLRVTPSIVANDKAWQTAAAIYSIDNYIYINDIIKSTTL